MPQAVPTKCAKCQRPMNTPLLCDACETLNPLPALTDHFQLFGLERRYEIDEQALHEAYLSLSRHSHPDYHVSDPPEVRALAQTVSAAVNEAYRVLADPVRRAAYLLELLGGSSSAKDKSVPEGFLDTMMMLQEELVESKADPDARKAARLREVLQTQHDGLFRRVQGLFAQLEQTSACEATRQDTLAEIRRQLNAIAYVRKLLTQV